MACVSSNCKRGNFNALNTYLDGAQNQNATGCGNAQLNRNVLMPAGWDASRDGVDDRQRVTEGKPCANWDATTGLMAATSDPTASWDRYAPSKEGVERYIMSAGASRMKINTRSSLGRQMGIPNLLRAPAPVPISSPASTANMVLFGDSQARQNVASAIFCQAQGNDCY